jgi:hypothetical protein
MWGKPKDEAPLMEWSDVERRLREAIVYWVVTQAGSRPVWGVWHEDQLWLSVGSTVIWSGLKASRDVEAHLEDGHDAVIVEGTTTLVKDTDVLGAFCDVYNAKYNWDFTSESAGVIPVLAPKVVLAWRTGAYTDAKTDEFPLAGARFLF